MNAPREGHWFAEPQALRWSLKQSAVSFGTLYFVYTMIKVVYIFRKEEMPDWTDRVFGWIMVACFAYGLMQIVFDTIARRPRRRDAAFSDRPAGIQEFPVEILVLLDGRVLGTDRGLVWFEDGLLNFNGRATSFALAAPDVVPRKWITTQDPYQNLSGDALRLSIDGPVAVLRVRPLLGSRWRFKAKLRRFLKENASTPKARQWPPLTEYGAESVPAPTLAESPEAVGEAAAQSGSATAVVRTRG